VSAPGGPVFSRRGLLAGSGLATAAVVAAAAGTTVAGAAGDNPGTALPFHGEHQAGITTPEQARMVFASFDVTATDRADLAALLATWTDAAERMTQGQPVASPAGKSAPPSDTGEALGLSPARLTLTVGFGPSLFDDRFGLSGQRPQALTDLPAFPGDQLDAARSNGDLCVQACADDAQVAFHAIHNLARLALGSATLRYLQTGFGRTSASGSGAAMSRNLLGFKDGTSNLVPTDPESMRAFVWVDGGDRAWMHGGSYLVARRIRIHLEAWDRSTLGDQERTIGRVKDSGAPIGATKGNDPVDLYSVDSSGAPMIPEDAHIRVAAPSTNHGAAILRRGYSFADGTDPDTGELDAGLFFISFQKDPALQFVPIQLRLASQDALASYLVHTGSGIFACPPGTAPGQRWGHGLI